MLKRLGRLVGAAWVLAVAGLWPQTAWAHPGWRSSANLEWYQVWYPEAFAQALGVFVLYLAVVGPWRRRYNWGEPPTRRQIFYFALGLSCFALAEATPIHILSEEYLFSVHMFQHMLILFAMPPLLIMGSPAWLLRGILFTWRPAAVVSRFLTRPVAAFIVFNAIFILWHLPQMYQLALWNHNLHILQHILFIFAGALMWWPVVSPLPESPALSEPLQIVYVTLLGAAQIAVIGPVTFLDQSVYPFYKGAFGITPIEDQQWGGIVKKLPSMIVMVSIIGRAFFRWAEREGEGLSGQGPSAAARPGAGDP